MASISLSSAGLRAIGLAALILLLVQGTFAHTYLSSLVLDGTALAEGDCVRSHPATAFDSPITLVTSPNMTCGFLPQSARSANRACPIAAGSTLGLQWHHNSASCLGNKHFRATFGREACK